MVLRIEKAFAWLRHDREPVAHPTRERTTSRSARPQASRARDLSGRSPRYRGHPPRRSPSPLGPSARRIGGPGRQGQGIDRSEVPHGVRGVSAFSDLRRRDAGRQHRGLDRRHQHRETSMAYRVPPRKAPLCSYPAPAPPCQDVSFFFSGGGAQCAARLSSRASTHLLSARVLNFTLREPEKTKACIRRCVTAALALQL